MMLPMPRHLVLASIPFVFAAAAVAQTRPPNHYQINATTASLAGEFGRRILGVGDFDGDAFADYAVAAPTLTVPGATGGGRVYLYSGRSGALIRTFDGDQGSASFGLSLADLGDVNGDLVRDLAVGSPQYDAPGVAQGGRLTVFSGATGAVLWTFDGTANINGNLGHAIGAIPDLTGDGVLDLAATEPGYHGTGYGLGRVRFFHGATGAPLGEVVGTTSFLGLGKSLATRPPLGAVYASDGNGNVYATPPLALGVTAPVLTIATPGGAAAPAKIALMTGPGGVPHLIVGRQYGDPVGVTNGGTVQLFLLSPLTAVFTFGGSFTNENCGIAVAAVDDQSGDGIDEIGFTSVTAVVNELRVRVTTHTGALLDDVRTAAAGGGDLGAIPDVTGDLRGEWLQTAANPATGRYDAMLFARGLSLTSTSTTSGFSAVFGLEASVANAGSVYFQLWSFAGSSPGFVGGAGWPLVPLNQDFLTALALGAAGSPVFPDAIGTLDAAGMATTNLVLDPAIAAAVVGFTATTVSVAINGAATAIVHASNPVVIVF